ncbi:hypothetical protein [Polaribacter sp. AHE13PA]|uniref:hypothetical protein n=1 Tax=Polaribacter sp. AHE13PA TaxID=2745562 RepID=UPI001C4E720D|nr:hypothetical protein [Polaribacter sp. AHE13PA]QXP68465.1 hypothetical protein H0I28_08220 [Polaribacter sp. AHE13PA]
MLKDYRENNNLESKSFTPIIVSPPLLKDQFIIHYFNSKNIILKLLASKKSKLVSEVNLKRGNGDIFDFTYDYDNEFELVEINDSQTEIYNSKENFEIVNELIIASNHSSIIIKNEVAIETLKQINESLKTETEDEFLVDGI